MKKILSAIVCCISFIMCGAETPKAVEKVKWVNLDDAHYLGGWQATQGDLDGFVVLLLQFPIQNTPAKNVLADLSKVRNLTGEDARFIEVCGVTGDKKSLAMYEKLVKKTKLRSFPAYEGLTVEVGDAKIENGQTGYIVVDHEGKMVFRGDSMKGAIGVIRKALKKMPPADPYFGLVQPLKNSSVTNLVVEGRSLMPVYAALRKSAAGKDPEAAEEANRLIAALDQTGHMRISTAMRLLHTAPGKASTLLESTLKMWPKAKSDNRVATMEAQFKKLEDLSKVVKIRSELERLSAIDPDAAKPMEKKKALADANIQKAKAAKLATSAKDGSVKIEAGHLENDLTALVSRLGGE